MKFSTKKLTPYDLGQLLTHLQVTGHDYYFNNKTKELIQVPKTLDNDLVNYIEEKQFEEDFS